MNIKKVSLTFSSLIFGLISASSLASPYIGIQAGISSMDYNSNEWSKTIRSSVDDNEFAGRVYGGYAFTDYLGAQLGYTYYGTVEFRDKATSLKEDFTQQGLDLSGIASLSFNYGLGGYLKAGVTWIKRGGLTENHYFENHNENVKFTSLLGGGVTYALSENMMGDLSWTRISGNGDLPKTDFFALGLTYKFNM